MSIRRMLARQRSPIARLARSPGALVRRVFERSHGGGPAGASGPTGSFSGTASVSATVKGSGALAGSFSGAGVVSATMERPGDLAGSFSGAGAVSATVKGSGDLSGAFGGAGAVSATVKGSGDLAGSFGGTASVSATMGSGLSGTFSGTSTASATLKGAGALAGSTAGTSTASATVKGSGDLAGSTAGVGAVSATVKGSGNLAGSTAGVGAVSATVTDASPPAIPTANAINAWTTDLVDNVGDIEGVNDDIGSVDLYYDNGIAYPGTIGGRDAADYDGYQTSMASGPATALNAITSNAEWHFWIVFQHPGTYLSTGNGAHYYEIGTWITDYAGWFGIGIQEDGTITCGLNSGGSDYSLHSAAAGYDDNAAHLIHFWRTSDAVLHMQIDDATEVTASSTGTPRTMGDSILCGSDWGVGLFVEGPWHAWTFGAMTAGEVSDMRAALASIYSVTV